MFKISANFNYLVLYDTDFLYFICRNTCDKIFCQGIKYLEVDPFNMNKLYYLKNNNNLVEAKYKQSLSILNTYQLEFEEIKFIKMIYYKRNSFTENIFCLNNKIIYEFYDSDPYIYKENRDLIDISFSQDNCYTLFYLTEDYMLTEFNIKTKQVVKNFKISNLRTSLTQMTNLTPINYNLDNSNNNDESFNKIFLNFLHNDKEIFMIINRSNNYNNVVTKIDFLNEKFEKIDFDKDHKIEKQIIGFMENESNISHYSFNYNNFSILILNCESSNHIIIFCKYFQKKNSNGAIQIDKIKLPFKLVQILVYVSFDVKKCLDLKLHYENDLVEKYRIKFGKSSGSLISLSKIMDLDLKNFKVDSNNKNINETNSINTVVDTIESKENSQDLNTYYVNLISEICQDTIRKNNIYNTSNTFIENIKKKVLDEVNLKLANIEEEFDLQIQKSLSELEKSLYEERLHEQKLKTILEFLNKTQGNFK